jgi:hypothetical protein
MPDRSDVAFMLATRTRLVHAQSAAVFEVASARAKVRSCQRGGWLDPHVGV